VYSFRLPEQSSESTLEPAAEAADLAAADPVAETTSEPPGESTEGVTVEVTGETAEETNEEFNEEVTIEPTPSPLALHVSNYVKVARVANRDYSVVVRYTSDSGIPADAVLTATEIIDPASYGAFYDDAKSALEENDEEMTDFFLLSISLVSNGVDYADSFGYEVEIVLNEDLEAEPEEIRAIQFGDDGATVLDTTAALNDEERVGRIAFRSEGEGGDAD